MSRAPKRQRRQHRALRDEDGVPFNVELQLLLAELKGPLLCVRLPNHLARAKHRFRSGRRLLASSEVLSVPNTLVAHRRPLHKNPLPDRWAAHTNTNRDMFSPYIHTRFFTDVPMSSRRAACRTPGILHSYTHTEIGGGSATHAPTQTPDPRLTKERQSGVPTECHSLAGVLRRGGNRNPGSSAPLVQYAPPLISLIWLLPERRLCTP